MYDFDIIQCFNSKFSENKILHFLVVSEDGQINIYGIPKSSEYDMILIKTLDLPSESDCHLVRTDIDTSGNLFICATDQEFNLHIWKNLEYECLIYGAHSKCITDIKWLDLQNDDGFH